MKQTLVRFINLFLILFKGSFTLKKKVFLFSVPMHPNLGDQAQLMCTEKWIQDNFNKYKLIEMPHLCSPIENGNPKALFFNVQLLQYIVLRLVIRKNDIFIVNSKKNRSVFIRINRNPHFI